MSEWRTIWKKAIRANQELELNRPSGEAAFQRLLKAHPGDGIVYYERAEAYEYIGQLDLVEADYTMAEGRLVLPHWKKAAREGLVRIRHRRQSPAATTRPQQRDLWALVHCMHAFPGLPPEVRVDAILAIVRADSEPHASATELRTCLERLVGPLLRDPLTGSQYAGTLSNGIQQLKRRGMVPPSEGDRMAHVLEEGNAGAHGRQFPLPLAILDVIEDSAIIAKWYAAKHPYHKAKSTPNGHRQHMERLD